MPTRTPARAKPGLWRLGAGAAGAGIGAAMATLLLAGLSWQGVPRIPMLVLVYYVLAVTTGLLFGLLWPPQMDPDWESEATSEVSKGFFGVGTLLCGLACVFLVWGWTPYRVLPVCTAVTSGVTSSSVTRTTSQRGKVINSETSYAFTYTVGGVAYRGSGESTTVRYDPARPDVYFSDDGLEARRSRIVEAPWVFAAGVGCLVVGVLFGTRHPTAWPQIWWMSLTMVLLGAGAATVILAWDEGAIGPRLAGKVERARPVPTEPARLPDGGPPAPGEK